MDKSLAPTSTDLANVVVLCLPEGIGVTPPATLYIDLTRGTKMNNEIQTKTKTKPNPNNMIQQTFHKSMFTRQRTMSTPSIPLVMRDEQNITSETKEEDKVTVTFTPTNAIEHQENEKDNWQKDRTPSRRFKRKETSPIQNDTNKKMKNRPEIAIPTHNSFDLLEDEQLLDVNKTKKVYVPKPEPIFVTGVLNVTSLKDALNRFVDSSLYTMTTLRSGHVIKIMPKDIQTYKSIRENFISSNISHYTYQLKSERAYRVILRGLHCSEDTKEIAQELTEMGHDVRQVVNALHRTSKDPLPMFYVDLEPKHNNKEIFSVKHINNLKVTFEAPYKKKNKEILQCKRCQRFGHTKNQCYRPFRCVKCGEEHSTSTCKKRPDTDATCANCLEKHPASYKGCKTYKQYKEKILKIAPKPKENQHKVSASDDKVENTINTPRYNHSERHKTYAEAIKAQAKPANQVEFATDTHNITQLLETMLEKVQQTIMAVMEKMMDKMLNSIVQLVSSLSKK